MPVSGYRSDKKTRYLDATGFKKLLIKNNKDLEILLTNNRTFAGELAHNLSSRTRITLIRRAAELNVKLTNGKGKVRVEEKKKDA